MRHRAFVSPPAYVLAIFFFSIFCNHCCCFVSFLCFFFSLCPCFRWDSSFVVMINFFIVLRCNLSFFLDFRMQIFCICCPIASCFFSLSHSVSVSSGNYRLTRSSGYSPPARTPVQPFAASPESLIPRVVVIPRTNRLCYFGGRSSSCEPTEQLRDSWNSSKNGVSPGHRTSPPPLPPLSGHKPADAGSLAYREFSPSRILSTRDCLICTAENYTCIRFD